MRSLREGVTGEWLLFAIATLLFVASHDFTPTDASFTPSLRDDGTLRVVTWNVGRALGEEGASAADELLGPIGDALDELSPDLILLQELASRSQLRTLGQRFGVGRSAQLSLPYGARVLGVLALKGELARANSAPAALIATWRPTEEAPPISVANLHAHAWSATGRNETIGAACDLLIASNDVSILAGDLNLDLDLDKRRDLFSDDSYLDVESYNYLTTHLVDLTRGTGSTAEPDRRLDYLFGAPLLTVTQRGPWRGKRVGGMDHDPVVIDIRLPQKEDLKPRQPRDQ